MMDWEHVIYYTASTDDGFYTLWVRQFGGEWFVDVDDNYMVRQLETPDIGYPTPDAAKDAAERWLHEWREKERIA